MFSILGLSILIFIILGYCAQKWAYKCYKELRKIREIIEASTQIERKPHYRSINEYCTQPKKTDKPLGMGIL